MTNNDNFENVKNSFINNYKNKVERLKITQEQLLEAQNNNDTRKIDFYSKRINSLVENIANLKNVISSMRPNTDKDLEERNDVLNNYAKKVNEVIPDDVPVVFHGNNNINTVMQIIESDGLFTPEERNVDFKSFATQIDVTAKTNVRVSLEFADAGMSSYMPYGAIFAFYPKEKEYENVFKTKDSSEVSGGVESINFIEEPDRLFSIITTEENIERIKIICEKKGIDSSKVLTHTQFIEYCKKNFKVQESENRMGDSNMNDKIRQSYIESNNLENAYNEMMSMYIMNGLDLEDLTLGTSQVEATLDSNELMLRGWLLETEMCKELNDQGINYDFNDLKQYVAQYGLENDVTLIQKVMKQYEMTEQLQKLEKRQISQIAFDLKDIIGNEMSRFNERGIIQPNGKTQLIQESKTPEELAMDHRTALLKAEELYVNEGQLDRNSYMQTVSMINKVFDNYMHGSKKIPIEQFRKMQQNVEFENTSSKGM